MHYKCMTVSLISILQMMQCLRRGLMAPPLSSSSSLSLRSASSTSEGDVRKPKTGILMLNMGGPRDSTEVVLVLILLLPVLQVGKFLSNLFADRDIIKLPFQDKVRVSTLLSCLLVGNISCFLVF